MHGRLFICGLFNYAINMASNGRFIVNKELEKLWKKGTVE